MPARVLAGIAAFAALLLLYTREVPACSCVPPPPPARAFAEADAVFLGTVLSFEALPAIHQRRAHLEILKIWKGNKDEVDTLYTPFDEAGCGYPFRIGVTYLVYAYQDGIDRLSTNLCTRTRPAEQAAQDLAHLDSLSYFPLAIGNWWRWRSTFQHVMRETVIDSLRAGGHLYHRFDQFREFSGAGLRWSNDRELIVREDTSEQVWLKFGAKIGESWRVYGPQRLAEWSVTLESTTDTVTTEAGRFFPCHRFSFKFAGADNDWVEWYALNVGPVKRVLFGFAVIEYVLIGAHLNGKNLPTLVTETPAAPRTLELGQSFPNPFAPDRAASHLRATTISYRLLRPAQVTLTIHDLLGRTINTLVQRRQAPGDYVVTWDGRDQHGARVPGGIYFCRLQAGGSVQTRKLAVIH